MSLTIHVTQYTLNQHFSNKSALHVFFSLNNLYLIFKVAFIVKGLRNAELNYLSYLYFKEIVYYKSKQIITEAVVDLVFKMSEYFKELSSWIGHLQK